MSKKNSKSLRRTVWNKALEANDPPKCHWCYTTLTRDMPANQPNSFTVDHVIPRGKGGAHEAENCVAACHSCNAHRAYVDQMETCKYVDLKVGSLELRGYRRRYCKMVDGVPVKVPLDDISREVKTKEEAIALLKCGSALSLAEKVESAKKVFTFSMTQFMTECGQLSAILGMSTPVALEIALSGRDAFADDSDACRAERQRLFDELARAEKALAAAENGITEAAKEVEARRRAIEQWESERIIGAASKRDTERDDLVIALDSKEESDRPKKAVEAVNPYDRAASARVGTKIKCPACGKTLVKRTYQHKFCCTKCKDHYWNGQPARLDRAVKLGYVRPAEDRYSPDFFDDQDSHKPTKSK